MFDTDTVTCFRRTRVISPSPVVREVRVKVRDAHTHQGGYYEQQKVVSVGEDMERLEPCALLVGCTWCRCCGNSKRSLRGLNQLPCDPAAPLLGIYPKELKWAPKRPLLSPVHSTMHKGIRAQHLGRTALAPVGSKPAHLCSPAAPLLACQPCVLLSFKDFCASVLGVSAEPWPLCLVVISRRKWPSRVPLPCALGSTKGRGVERWAPAASSRCHSSRCCS